jgi:Zn-dependent protease
MSLHDRHYTRGSGRGGGGSRGWSDGYITTGGTGDFFRRVLAFLNLSFPIGRYFGIGVRVHILFVLLVIFEIWPSARLSEQGVGAGEQMLGNLRRIALLFGSVLLHEFGHCFGCRAVGGRADNILMWPLGGLAYVDPPRRPWPEFVTVACGPLVNVVLASASYLILLAWLSADRMPVSLDPFTMWRDIYWWLYHDDIVVRLLADLFVVNYVLLLFNVLLIFYPFDGGRIVQVILWVWLGYGRSMVIATTLGMYGAVIVAGVGIWKGQLLLVLIAVMGFMTCWQQRKMLKYADAYEPDGDARFAAAYETQSGGRGAWFTGSASDQATAAARRPGKVARWRAERAAKQAEAQRRRAQADEAEIDRILDKVRAQGLPSLTQRERDVLQRATEQKRGG